VRSQEHNGKNNKNISLNYAFMLEELVAQNCHWIQNIPILAAARNLCAYVNIQNLMFRQPCIVINSCFADSLLLTSCQQTCMTDPDSASKLSANLYD